VRDLVSFVLGWGLIGYEVLLRPDVRESVLLLAATAVGIPGLALGASSVAEAVRSRAGTGSPSEQAPSGPSSPSPPS
jgi:hypothetical protein